MFNILRYKALNMTGLLFPHLSNHKVVREIRVCANLMSEIKNVTCGVPKIQHLSQNSEL